jgi:hypothetical protein
MVLDEAKIRHEIINFIDKKPHCRTKQIVDYVLSKKIASETPIYKILSVMVDEYTLTKMKESEAEAYYDITDTRERQDKWLEEMSDTLEDLQKEMNEFSKNQKADTSSSVYLKNMKSILEIIRRLQNVELLLRIANNPKALKKLKSWKNIEKSIDILWESIEEYIDSQGNSFGIEIWRNYNRHI